MTRTIAAAVAFVCVLAVGVLSSTASAVLPPPECQGNPHFCHGGDTITVESEPAGENCEFGGVKITVIHKHRGAPTKTENPPEPEEEVFYVCNGAPGPAGPPGPPGDPGPEGTIVGPGGLPINVTQDTTVNVNITNGNRRCKSIRKRARLVLPSRMRDESTVRVKVDRARAISSEVVRSRFVRVNMRGKRCGAHVVQVRKRGIDPSLRLWTVTSATGINKRILVP